MTSFPLSLVTGKSVIEKDSFQNECIVWNALQYNCTTIPINFFAISKVPGALYFFLSEEGVSIGLIRPTNLQNSAIKLAFPFL